MDSEAANIPIEELDKILSQLKELLKILDEYLCGHITILPIEVRKKSNKIYEF